MNLARPVYQLLNEPLVGPRTDSSTSMPYPGFETGTFGSAAGFPNRFAACRRYSLRNDVYLKGLHAKKA